mmetsp:Transcript_25205/g.52372  ORF Transcript_25205/g.52372 Transcript_25205/m.52372 type:complete len:266 (+) Transcript_25205:309-1106(+)
MVYPIFCLVVLGTLLVQVAPWGMALATQLWLPRHHHQRLELQPWHRGVRQTGRRRHQATVTAIATIPTLRLILTTFRLWVEPLLCKVQVTTDPTTTTITTTRTMDWRRHYGISNGYWRINSSYNNREVDRIHNNSKRTRNSKNNNSNNNEGDSTDDISWAESWTQGSNTTGTSTTGESSSGDDWTNSTDDSRMFYCNHNRNSQQYGRKSWHNSNGRCMTNEQMMRSVAEDVGVFAGLLFSDGVACLGTAAAITKETVADCNRKHH